MPGLNYCEHRKSPVICDLQSKEKPASGLNQLSLYNLSSTPVDAMHTKQCSAVQFVLHRHRTVGAAALSFLGLTLHSVSINIE